MLVNAVKQCHHAAVKVINISQLACFSFLGSFLMIHGLGMTPEL